MGKGSGKGGADAPLKNMKVFVVIVNVMSALTGLALLGLGIYAFVERSKLLYSNVIPGMLVTLGTLVFLWAIVGCIGAIFENKLALKIYFGCLLVLILFQAVIVTYTLANMNKIEDVLDTAWQNAYDHHPKLLRDIQNEYSCCGFRSPTDRALPKSAPDACLKSKNFGYEDSCLEQLSEAYKNHQTAISIAGIVIAVIQLGSLLATWALIQRLPLVERQREEEYLEEHQRLVDAGKGRPTSATTGESSTDYGATGNRKPKQNRGATLE
ncbi:hypothetical protein BZG36_03698 [Bifiguratus adelaidae]|uniref:Tetraspanin n=1 Tax=Bifiguratus adelaidae TaxID=1938954 RepID=A0A261XZ01_9FUNG|nr:hypothetical protein BZG36_03698 [Bifiguratus adelaidae]